jgi:16S rRNA processing protein RimM
MVQYLEIGKIVTTHGIGGEVKVYISADSPESLFRVKKVYLDPKASSSLNVVSHRAQKNMLLLKFDGINSIDEAHGLIGKTLWADRNEIKKDKDSYFVVDLIGLEVVNAVTEEHIGVIDDVISGGIQDLYSVKLDNGETRLMPAVPAFLKKTSIEEGRIWVEPIKGMFDDAD